MRRRSVAITTMVLAAVCDPAFAGFSETEITVRSAVHNAKLIVIGRISLVENIKYRTQDGMGREQAATGYIFTLKVTETLKGDTTLKTVKFFDRRKFYAGKQKTVAFLSPVNPLRTRIPQEALVQLKWEYVSSANRYPCQGPKLDALIAYTKKVCKQPSGATKQLPGLTLSIEDARVVERKNKEYTLLLVVRFFNSSRKDISLSDVVGVGLAVKGNKRRVDWHSRSGSLPTAGSFSVLPPGHSLVRKVGFDGVLFEKNPPLIEAYYRFGIYSNNCGMLLTEPDPWCGIVRTPETGLSEDVKKSPAADTR